MTTPLPKIDESLVKKSVKEMFSCLATCPDMKFHFPTGRNSCLQVGYRVEELNRIPESAVESFAGVGYPFLAEIIEPGNTVVDIGSGSGVDIMIARIKTGPQGMVYGIDFTPEMIEKARKNCAAAGMDRIQIIDASADNIPLKDSGVDVVTSNGALNLVPDKIKAYDEIYRILKPGGYIQISDTVLSKPVPAEIKYNARLWAEFIAGAEPVDIYLDLIRSSGFKNVIIIDRLDFFAGSYEENIQTEAKKLGAHSVVLTGRKENQMNLIHDKNS